MNKTLRKTFLFALLLAVGMQPALVFGRDGRDFRGYLGEVYVGNTVDSS